MFVGALDYNMKQDKGNVPESLLRTRKSKGIFKGAVSWAIGVPR